MKDAGDKEIFGRRRIVGARDGQQKLDGLCWGHEHSSSLGPVWCITRPSARKKLEQGTNAE